MNFHQNRCNRGNIMAYFPKLGPFYDPNYEQDTLTKPKHGDSLRNNDSYGKEVQSLGSTSFDRTSNSHNLPDKVQEGWKSHVRQQGDLFYVDVNGTNGYNSDQYTAYSTKQNDHHNHVHHQNTRARNLTLNLNNQHNNEQYHEDYSSSNQHPHKNNKDCVISEKNYVPQNGQTNYNGLNQYHHLNDYNNHHKRHPSNYSDDGYFDSEVGSQSSRTSTPRSSHKYQDTSHDGQDIQTTDKKGKFKSVYLRPNFRNCNMGELSGVKLCEEMFGIILCQYNNKSTQVNHNNNVIKDRKIIVQGVVPESAAWKCGSIHRGDMLQSVNSFEISWYNIDKIFQSVSSKKVKLTFQVPNVIGPKTPTNSSPPTVPPQSYKQIISRTSPTTCLPPRVPHRAPSGENIVQLVTGDSVTGLHSLLKSSMCSVMYLTLEGSVSEESEKDDILYWFPCEETKLSDVRGLFLTLSGILPDVTGTYAKSSCLRHNNQQINIVYKTNGKELLVLALPTDRAPLHFLECIMQELHRIVLLLFKSLSGAFKMPRYRNYLDQLICLTLHGILKSPDQASSQFSQALLGCIPGPKVLDLSHDNKLLCDEILSEFEAADFDDLEEDLPFDRRTFTILGTCLFYKDFLLCNHLPAEDLRDIHLFMKYHCLLQLVSKQTVEELVVWREVYPTRLCHNPETPPPGYSEPTGRWFLLIVGMKNFLLGTLLEAGGCARIISGNPRPDPFYISQAKATLLQLETDDVVMADCCQNRLLSERSGPSLVSADTILFGGKSKREENSSTPAKSQGSPKSPSTPLSTIQEQFFKWSVGPYFFTDRKLNSSQDEVELDRLSFGRSNSHQGSESSTPMMKRQGSKISYGSNDSGGSGSSNGVGKTPTNKSMSKAGSIADVSFTNQSLNQSMTSGVPDEARSVYPIKVTKGADNVLFYYLNFDHTEGVLVSPTPQEAGNNQGPVHTQVLYNFNKACLLLRKQFSTTLQNYFKKEENVQHKFGSDSSFKHVHEQGVMFQCSPVPVPENKKSPPSPYYWVVGRLYPNKRELFVCFHESAPQTAIEMAFRLGFGV